jgi:hypothetical protein
LESRHDDDLARFQRPYDLGGIDLSDAGLPVRTVGLDPYLMTQKGACRLSQLLQRETQQRDRHLLSGRQEHIFLTLIRYLGDLVRKGHQPVGLARHGGDYDNDLVAGPIGETNLLRHSLDPLHRPD